jgi:hypothetical protein
MSAPTRMRGFSEAKGSWKIIWRESSPRAGVAALHDRRPSSSAGRRSARGCRQAMRPSVDLPQPTRRPGPRPRRRHVQADASTACTISSRLPAPRRWRSPRPASSRRLEALRHVRELEQRRLAHARTATSSGWMAARAARHRQRRRRHPSQAASARRSAAEGAARGRRSSDGVMPGICAQRLPARVAARHRADQPARIGMARDGQHVVHGAALDDAAGVHDADLVGEAGDDREVVGDPDQRGARLAASFCTS